MIQQQPENRLAQLDGLRGIAISLVLLRHYYCNLVELNESSPWWWIRKATTIGWAGVDCFFVLSGFLIGRILLRNRGSANYFSVFYFRRACRILPLYFLSLGIYLILRVAYFEQVRNSALN